MSDDLPQPLSDLSDFLAGRGYTSSDRRWEPFRGREVEHVSDGVRIALSRERGDWTIEIGSVDWQTPYDDDVWRACLDGVPAVNDLQATPLEARVVFVRERIEQIESAIKWQAGIEQCLRDAERDWADRTYGPPGSSHT